jgi:GT2 family glycosyltransferase
VAKRAVFDRVGHLDPIFFAFFEEIDLCRRARAAGFQVAIVPSSKIHHHRGGSFGQARHSRQRSFLLLRNSMIYSSTDPAVSLWHNVWRLARSNVTHLKSAVVGTETLAVWLEASCSVLVRLPALYRKWQADKSVCAP